VLTRVFKHILYEVGK